MKRATEHNEEDFWHIIGTNLESPYHLCQIAYPLLKASGKGNIVFISSVAGKTALPALAIYSASKGKCLWNDIFNLQFHSILFICFFFIINCAGAINQLTKNLAYEWAKDNIRVNTVAPWAVKTNIIKPVPLSTPF